MIEINKGSLDGRATVRHLFALTSVLHDQEAIMKATVNLFAHASIVSIFLATSIFAGADEARDKVAVTETSQQTIGPADEQQGPPRAFRVAQQCQSGRDDCMTRPQERCGPGLNGCLSLGQANCKDDTAGPSTPNTTGIDNALKNPNLSPEQRANFEASRQRVEQARSRRAHFQYTKCLTDVVNQCRATHC